ncbi:MAG: hypothetical protein CME67_03715 [Halobacteriovoraceae bacterium]|nr:hypothetical protein [Halobacteriovoraceae bacterium]|tara:strand:+ start:937 stop:1980 length:1044 start_codon:yes stop_codon:yes gene_type:complete
MKFIVLVLCSIFVSCAKLSYIVDQGVGQVALEWKARSNEEVLADEKVDKKHKEKIKQIMAYKKFFYEYFDKEPTNIYSQTTFLDRPAVTYLVIASPVDKVEALRHSFPIVGEFPYLGFFSQKEAKNFALDLTNKGYEVYTRPVYAYSTLNQWIFDDNILSSFFEYNEVELAEMIFHELFHTVFFIKNEVDLNENLAQFFSRELVFEYFNYSDQQKALYWEKHKKDKILTGKVAGLAKELQAQYLDKGRIISNAKSVREEFLETLFRPEISKTCEELKVSNCWPLKKTWNNARFAAFLTYESGQGRIQKLRKHKNLPDLKTFFAFLVNERENHLSSEGSFGKKLFKEI